VDREDEEEDELAIAERLALLHTWARIPGGVSSRVENDSARQLEGCEGPPIVISSYEERFAQRCRLVVRPERGPPGTPKRYGCDGEWSTRAETRNFFRTGER
jgi:hypothetical protein